MSSSSPQTPVSGGQNQPGLPVAPDAIDLRREALKVVSQTRRKSIDQVDSKPKAALLEAVRIHGMALDPKRKVPELEPWQWWFLILPPSLCVAISVLFALFGYASWNTKAWEAIAVLFAVLVAGIAYYRMLKELLDLDRKGPGALGRWWKLTKCISPLALASVAGGYFLASYAFGALEPSPKADSHPQITIHDVHYLIYVGCVWIVTATFVVLDSVISGMSVDHKETVASTKSFVFASVPTCISVGIVLLYCGLMTGIKAWGNPINLDLNKVHEFVGGALAFQMLVSNVVFIFVTQPVFEEALVRASQSTKRCGH